MTYLSSVVRAEDFSKRKIEELREGLATTLHGDKIAVVVVGSYGRQEASPQSDLDFFILQEAKGAATEADVDVVREAIKQLGIRMPSSDGAFDAIESVAEITRNIGGSADPNEKLTRRMLYLLEGDWLFNRSLFEKVRTEIISQYVRDTITQHQLCRFLLNDVIRYYRTICVDFENKTHQNGKSWGDRNIKLMFSRKFLYFSGVVAIAETYQNTWQKKREILSDYLALTPIRRVLGICGESAVKVISMYEQFIADMEKPEIREMLRNTTEIRKDHSDEFRDFKNRGHHFTLELSRLLGSRFEQSHPIHVALRF